MRDDLMPCTRRAPKRDRREVEKGQRVWESSALWRFENGDRKRNGGSGSASIKLDWDEQSTFEVLARAKRERVVQDGVEKANRRPTDDATRPPSLLLWNLTSFDEIPFCRKWTISDENWWNWGALLIKNWQFSTKIAKISENWWNWSALLWPKWISYQHTLRKSGRNQFAELNW